jgi:hypothetical protein
VAAVVGGITAFLLGGGTVKLLGLALGVNLFAPVVGGVFGGTVAIGTFFIAYVYCLLVTPIAMMEKRKIREGFARSRHLTKRAFLTSLAAAAIMFLIPMVLASCLSFFVNVTAKAFDPEKKDKPAVVETVTNDDGSTNAVVNTGSGDNGSIGWTFGRTRPKVDLNPEPMDMRTKLKHTVLESTVQIIWLPLQIIVLSFSGIIVALLYIKTRLAGGESMHDLIERFEDDGRPKKKWQERVRARLIQSGRIPSKP